MASLNPTIITRYIICFYLWENRENDVSSSENCHPGPWFSFKGGFLWYWRPLESLIFEPMGDCANEHSLQSGRHQPSAGLEPGMSELQWANLPMLPLIRKRQPVENSLSTFSGTAFQKYGQPTPATKLAAVNHINLQYRDGTFSFPLPPRSYHFQDKIITTITIPHSQKLHI